MGRLTAVALTFDVDCQAYVGGTTRPMLEELEVALDALGPLFERHPGWRATWFLRIDPEVDQFAQQTSLLAPLLAAGHEIGWHYHGPLKRIREYAREARRRALDASRIGFGRCSNQVMRTLAAAGFDLDSTAMPRPAYPWSRRGVDWSISPQTPYRPSVADYRIPGHPSLPIVEVPISCTLVRAPGDNQEVIRYVNPAYHPQLFSASLGQWLAGRQELVTITHPYELCGGRAHDLLSFRARAFEENVEAIERGAGTRGSCTFTGLNELARRSSLEAAGA